MLIGVVLVTSMIQMVFIWNSTSETERRHRPAKEEPPKKSWSLCSEGRFGRTCVHHNFCVGSEGVFPRFRYHQQFADEWAYISLVDGGVERNPAGVRWAPSAANQSIISKKAIIERDELWVYAPGWQPYVPVFHLLFYNVVPLFFSMRALKRRWGGSVDGSSVPVWKYPVDLMSFPHGASFVPWNTDTFPDGMTTEWFQSLGVERLFSVRGTELLLASKVKHASRWIDAELPQRFYNQTYQENMYRATRITDTNGQAPLFLVCYKRVMAGVNVRVPLLPLESEFRNIPDYQPLWSDFRSAFIWSHCTNKTFPPSQRLLENPKLVIIQRASKPHPTWKDRRFADVQVLVASAARFFGTVSVVEFSASVSLCEQAQVFAGASVVVGIHGNAFSWISMMQPGTILIDIRENDGDARRDFFKNLASSVGVERIEFFAKDQSNPNGTILADAFKAAAERWRYSFRRSMPRSFRE